MILFQGTTRWRISNFFFKSPGGVSPSWTKMYLCKCMLHTLTGRHNLLFSKTADCARGYEEGQNVSRAHCK